MKQDMNKQQDPLQLFADPREKGSGEWDAFQAVQSDRAAMFRVASPNKPIVLRGPHHLLKIISIAPQRQERLRGAH
mgnify:CR=1 FL=1